MRKALFVLNRWGDAGIAAIPQFSVLVAGLLLSTLSLSSTDAIASTIATNSSLAPVNAHAEASVPGSAIVQYAMKFLGYPYTATGNSPSTGFSCIGFVSYVYRSEGINLPGDLGGAMAFAPSVSFSDLQPGDVLYFQNTVWAGLSHAAIYIGGGRFIHAEWYNRGVVISSFTNDPVDGNYWSDHYLGANRPWTSASAPAIPTPLAVQPVPTAVIAPTAPPAPVRRQAPARRAVLVHVPSLNVRARPSLRSSILTVVTQGTGLIVLGRHLGWYRVSLPDGTIGWVVGMGIGKQTAARRRSGNGAGSPASGASSTSPLSAPAFSTNKSTQLKNGVRGRRKTASVSRAARRSIKPATTRMQGAVTVQVNGLRVHTSPSLGAAVLGSADRGQRLTVVARTGAWIKVALPNGSIGWISSHFAQVQSGSRTVQATGRVARSSSSRIGSSSTYIRARAALNVRARPSLSGPIAAVVVPGGAFQILGWSNGWAHVRLESGSVGWISGTVLSGSNFTGSSPTPKTVRRQTTGSSSSRAAPNIGQRSVVTAGVRIHSSAGLTSSIIGLVAAGTHVQVLASNSGWAKVRLPSHQTGYILGIYVKK